MSSDAAVTLPSLNENIFGLIKTYLSRRLVNSKHLSTEKFIINIGFRVPVRQLRTDNICFFFAPFAMSACAWRHKRLN